MEWDTLLNPKRLRRTRQEIDEGRSPFQKDIDRIVYSAAFRRLANKTQVHPLPENDHIHNRLTHSIETASVGRSLGTIVGKNIETDLQRYELTRDDLGYVVQAACLAHDIGNPPFGHAGEQAIGNWFQQKFGSEDCTLDKLGHGLINT
ncbi:MAG: dNTP triphosphohydrolase [Rhodospirillales bacterium]|nr:dNTP triphosphohydrolase [Rhodospirillales bacterium]